MFRKKDSRPLFLTASMILVLVSCLSGALWVYADEKDGAPSSAPTEPAPAKPKAADRFEARCSDGSVLRLHLLEQNIPLKTEYGTLVIPAADIRRIDFATRVPDALAERIKAAVGKLGDKQFQVREAASAELLALEDAGYPSLLVAVESQDPEVVLRADQLLEQLRKLVPEENLRTQPRDVIYTEKSQIEGTIDLDSLKVDTAPFGQQQLKLVVLRRLVSELEVERQPGEVLPDPGNLTNYRGQTGKTLHFRVSAPPVGIQNGAVWGSDVYTFDSSLAMSAVHAGVLKPGETKVLGVTILGPQNSFASAVRNGVSSGNWGPYPAGFKFKTGRDLAPGFRRGNVNINR
jgi:hypothetical protein